MSLDVLFASLRQHPAFILDTPPPPPARNLVRQWFVVPDAGKEALLWTGQGVRVVSLRGSPTEEYDVCQYSLSPPFSQTLIPEPAPPFAVEQILLPVAPTEAVAGPMEGVRCAEWLLLVGSRGLAAMELPRRDAGGQFRYEDKAHICKCVSLGEYHIQTDGVEVLQAAWHPWSSAHVLALFSDATVRMYDMSNDGEEEIALDVSSSSPPTGFCFAGRALRGGSGLAEASLSWAQFALLIVRASGEVCSLCPVLPLRCWLPVGLLNSLRRTAQAQLEQTRGTAVGNIARRQLKWLRRIWAEGFPDRGEPEQDQGWVDVSPPSGGFVPESVVVVPSQEGKDFCAVACVASFPPAFVVACRSGQLFVFVATDELRARWCGDQTSRSLIRERKRPPLLLERIATGRGEALRKANSSVGVWADPFKRDVFYVSHAGGAHVLALPWVDVVEQMNTKPSTQLPASVLVPLVSTREPIRGLAVLPSRVLDPCLLLWTADDTCYGVDLSPGGAVRSVVLSEESAVEKALKEIAQGAVDGGEDASVTPFGQMMKPIVDALKAVAVVPLEVSGQKVEMDFPQCMHENVLRWLILLNRERQKTHGGLLNAVYGKMMLRLHEMGPLIQQQQQDMEEIVTQVEEQQRIAQLLEDRLQEMMQFQKMLRDALTDILQDLHERQPTLSRAERAYHQELREKKEQTMELRKGLERLGRKCDELEQTAKIQQEEEEGKWLPQAHVERLGAQQKMNGDVIVNTIRRLRDVQSKVEGMERDSAHWVW